MTFPSAACQTCKLRRIKCDETKPDCQRCMKSRRVCLEANGADFLIHTENSYASGKTKRPRGPRSSLTVMRPNFDLQTRALAYYLQFHLQGLGHVPNLTKGLPECIFEWKVSRRSCDMVDLAVSSLALSVFSRTQQNPPAAKEASSRYHRLLRVASQRIGQLWGSAVDDQNIDACLLSVSLMGRYEGTIVRLGNVSWSDPLASRQIWSHHDGAMAILKVWYDNPSRATPTMIIKQTRRGLIRSCLLRHHLLPDWMLNGEVFGEQGLELEYDYIFTRSVDLHHESMHLLRANGLVDISKARALSDEARKLDKDLQVWAVHIPNSCAPEVCTLPESGSFPRKHFYSSKVYSYPTPGHSGAWSQLYSVRLLISSTRLKLLKTMGSDLFDDFSLEQERLECITQLQAIADDLTSSLPFCLDRFKVDSSSPPGQPKSIILNANNEIRPYLATFAVWPLTIASSVDGIDAKQQQWFRSELAGIGRVTGDAILECAANHRWDFL